MPTARARIKIFLIIYCPSIVGVKKPCQTKDGSKNKGIAVIIRCANKNIAPRRSNRGIRNITPISISNIPKHIMNVEKGRAGSVLFKSEATIGLAGLSPKNFNAPNQKYTRKIAKRDRGKDIFVRKLSMYFELFSILSCSPLVRNFYPS